MTKFCLIGYDVFLIARCRLQYVMRDTKVTEEFNTRNATDALAPKHPTPSHSLIFVTGRN